MLIRRRMYVILGLLVFAVSFVDPAMAVPNFSGAWIRDAGASGPLTAVIGPIRTLSGTNNLILSVYHSGRYLQVKACVAGTERKNTEYVLGRGWHGNAPNMQFQFVGGAIYRSKWKKQTLVIEKKASFHGNYRDLHVQSNQQWILSPGGKELTVTTTTYENWKPIATIREVFSKK